VIGSFKSAVSRKINQLRPHAADDLWQSSYFEHVVRDDCALENIREYIFTNPERWHADALNSDGSGADTLEAFIASLSALPKKGDAGVAPTGESRRA